MTMSISFYLPLVSTLRDSSCEESAEFQVIRGTSLRSNHRWSNDPKTTEKIFRWTLDSLKYLCGVGCFLDYTNIKKALMFKKTFENGRCSSCLNCPRSKGRRHGQDRGCAPTIPAGQPDQAHVCFQNAVVVIRKGKELLFPIPDCLRRSSSGRRLELRHQQ